MVLLTWCQNRHAVETPAAHVLYGYAIHTLLLKEGYIILKATNIPLQKMSYSIEMHSIQARSNTILLLLDSGKALCNSLFFFQSIESKLAVLNRMENTRFKINIDSNVLPAFFLRCTIIIN